MKRVIPRGLEIQSRAVRGSDAAELLSSGQALRDLISKRGSHADSKALLGCGYARQAEAEAVKPCHSYRAIQTSLGSEDRSSYTVCYPNVFSRCKITTSVCPIKSIQQIQPVVNLDKLTVTRQLVPETPTSS